MLPPVMIPPPPKISVSPLSHRPCDPYSSWGAWKMVRCRLGGNVFCSTRCLAATEGRLRGGQGAGGYASERGLLTPADIPLRFLSVYVCVRERPGACPSPPPPKRRRLRTSQGAHGGRGAWLWPMLARSACSGAEEWNAIRGGESSPRHELGRWARDTITSRIREARAQ